MSDNIVALMGAGAEADLELATGTKFTWDTFYTKKPELYKALGEFYSTRLSGDYLPRTYLNSFLFDKDGLAFKSLITNIANSGDCSFLQEHGYRGAGQDLDSFIKARADELFDSLVLERAANEARRRMNMDWEAFDDLRLHFGLLEPTFSSLLVPRKRPRHFWKLINFYWSAFFSILLPITDVLYRGNSAYGRDCYKYVLGDLQVTIEKVFGADFLKNSYGKRNCYYNQLKGCFSSVLTTNYTPFGNLLFDDCGQDGVIRLAGSLSTFEYPHELRVADVCKGSSIGAHDFVFPYMMCQAPVKPLIGPLQIEAYSDAAEALRKTDKLFVLGYRFCDEDSHIKALVREWLVASEENRLVYCAYGGEGRVVDSKACAADVGGRLRVEKDVIDRQIKARQVQNCDAFVFLELNGGLASWFDW